MQIHIKRAYETSAPTDEFRVLIDRLWPRGLSKQGASIDIWVRHLAPSDKLRKWFGHDDGRFEEFARRYRQELETATAGIDELIAAAGTRSITLVYAAKNTDCNNAIVLRECLNVRLRAIGETA